MGAAGCRPAGSDHWRVQEIQLFSKSKSPRAKDQVDFDTTLPLLSAAQRRWLDDAITTIHGSPARLGKLAEIDVS